MYILKYKGAQEWTREEQLEKIGSEFEELKKAKTRDNRAEEILDLVQSAFTLFFVEDFTDDEIEWAIRQHIKKLTGRDLPIDVIKNF